MKKSSRIFSSFWERIVWTFFWQLILQVKIVTVRFGMCKLICLIVLSHGESSIERGFTINKEVLQDNLQEKSLVPQRLIIEEFEIRKSLQLHCKLSSQRYKQ